MPLCAFHSANAGFYLWDGTDGLLIDGLHDGREEGFSPTPPELVAKLETGSGLFAHLSGLLFTHLHPDHYDRALVAQLDGLPCFGPGLCHGVTPVHGDGGVLSLRLGPGDLLCLPTVHDGAALAHTPHYACLLRMGGQRLFFAGDALLRAQEAEALQRLDGGQVDGAFLNLYQLAGRDGQAFLAALRPRRVFLCHLPLPADDRFHYRAQADYLTARYPAQLPALERLAPMQWIDGIQPPWGP